MSPATQPILLLHGSGWDELAMVAIGLLLAWAVISFTGRQAPAGRADEEITAEEPRDHGA